MYQITDDQVQSKFLTVDLWNLKNIAIAVTSPHDFTNSQSRILISKNQRTDPTNFDMGNLEFGIGNS